MPYSEPVSPSATTPLSEAANRAELDHLFSVTYEELRRLAAAVRGNDPGETLNPTALVNEAYLKLADSLSSMPLSRLHFKRIAARAMRQVLVEAARRRSALKRGGGDVFVTLDEALDGTVSGPEELLALDGALEKLARLNRRQASLVEFRFFGGFDLNEIAQLLGVSLSTIARDWRVAKAWLALELKRHT